MSVYRTQAVRPEVPADPIVRPKTKWLSGLDNTLDTVMMIVWGVLSVGYVGFLAWYIFFRVLLP